jgi:GNAT superfamily N-acetyltransferase
MAAADDGLPELLADIHERSAVVAYAHIFDSPFPREDSIERWARFRGDVALGCLNGEIVGFAAWEGDLLSALYILPEAAGCGVGNALHAQAESATRLWVLEKNDHARRFYEARGWAPTGVSQEVYAGGVELEYGR